MNLCTLEKVGTKEYGQMLKRILILEEGGESLPTRGWKIEEGKRTVARKECKTCERDQEVPWLKKSCGTLPRRACWKTDELCLKKVAID